MGRALRQYKETRVLDTEEAALFRATCTALTATVYPFVADCFTKIFPSPGRSLDLEPLAAILGTPAPVTGDGGGSGTVAVETLTKVPSVT